MNDAQNALRFHGRRPRKNVADPPPDGGSQGDHEVRATTRGIVIDYGATINFVIVFITWLAYVVLAPLLWLQSPWLALLVIPLIGGYLASWLLYYRHELWHNYFPGLNNERALDLVSYTLMSIPQAYRVCHGSHHKHVHTYEDMEFFCQDYATDRTKRRRQFLLEVFFGNIAWEWSTTFRLARAGKISSRDRIKARIGSLTFLAIAAGLSYWIQPGNTLYLLLTFVLTAWLGAVVTRQSQWIEHLGIHANGCSLHERDMLTRNLPSNTTLGWLVNFYTHNDAREHVLHHTEPGQNLRAVDGLSLPKEAHTTTVGEHLWRLWSHYRSL